MIFRRWLVVLLFAISSVALVTRGNSQTITRFGSLPINSNPGTTFFQGQDGNFYGVLRETNLPLTLREEYLQSQGIDLPLTNGAIYQLTPDGKMRYLHQFPRMFSYPSENAVGAQATDALAMGRDGYLYGIAQEGGLNGYGLFFKLSVNGDYQAVSHMPGHAFHPYNFQGFFQGPDDAFYTYITYGKRRIIRLGLDGSITELGEQQPTSYAVLLQDPLRNDRCALAWTDEYNIPHVPQRQNKITVRWIELPSGTVLSENVYEPFSAAADYVGINRLTDEGLLAATRSTDWRNALPGRLVLLKRDGSISTITDFSPQSDSTGGSLPPALQGIIPSKQGGYYFTAGEQTRGPIGVPGGTRLFRLHPDNSFEFLCDFNGYPLVSMFEANDGFLYGVSWGTGATEAPPEEEEVEVSSFAIRSMARAQVDQRSSARTLVRSRHGAFRRKPEVENPNVAPSAKSDSIILPRRIGAAGITIPVLQNDRDPERSALTLTEVSEATTGTVTIATNPKGKQFLKYIPSLTPAASEILHYKITDAGGQSASGQVFIRGDVRGVYRQPKASTQPVSTEGNAADSFSARITPAGSFTVTATAGGHSFKAKGKLDYRDSATLYRKSPAGTLLQMTLRVETTETAKKALSYTFHVGTQSFTGTVTR